jgi:hypothetical protein
MRDVESYGCILDVSLKTLFYPFGIAHPAGVLFFFSRATGGIVASSSTSGYSLPTLSGWENDAVSARAAQQA